LQPKTLPRSISQRKRPAPLARAFCFVIASVAKQSILPLRGAMDCFAQLAMAGQIFSGLENSRLIVGDASVMIEA
jgi:hypothetical protein